MNWLVLGGLLVCGLVAVLRRSVSASLLLSVGCAIWLPLNNEWNEGPVLLALEPGHGLTSMDLVAYSGLAVACSVCLTSGHRRLRVPLAALCCLTVAAGLACAYFLWSGPPVPTLVGGRPGAAAGNLG
ncbi:MAG: hypothetical protein ABI808_12515 [Pseudonocardiales bacterium]